MLLRAALRYFLGVFAAGFVLGTLRTVALSQLPSLSPLVAVALELPLILGFSAWFARATLRRHPLATDSARLAMGLIALALLLGAEALLSLLLAGRTLTEHLALYAEAPHQLGLAAQVLFALFPWLLGRRTIRPTPL